MRSSKSLFLAGCLTVLALVLIGMGCSDDRTTTTVVPVEVEPDNGINAHLDNVSAQAETNIDSILTVIESGLEVATFIDSDAGDIGNALMGGILPDSVSDENHWIVSWATDLQAGLGTLMVTDSLTYIVDGAISVNARHATGMHIKHYYSYLSSDTTVSFTDVGNFGNLSFTGIDGNTASINGTYTTVINDKEVTAAGTTWNDWTLEATLSDIDVTKTGSSWTNGCPESGTIVVNVEHRYAEDLDVPVTTEWEMTATFTDGTANIDVVTGQLSTSYVMSFCTP